MSVTKTFESRSYSLNDQLAFAKLSGDDNPMHVDPIIARRLLFGGPVVHGMHAVCQALNSWLGTRQQAFRLHSLNVVFRKPMLVGVPVELLIDDESRASIKMRLLCAGELTTRITCEIGPVPASPGDTRGKPILTDSIPDRTAALGSCQDRSKFEGASGSLPLLLPRGLAEDLFPHLTAKLPSAQTALLLATTRLVGTECPGLHSIYAGLQLTFTDRLESDQGLPSQTLKWAVSAYDERFGSLSLALTSPHGTGSIKAFVRPRPQIQPTFAELKSLVGRNDFADQRALVVGGSRGLGEVCAKLLSAGGADVCVTYHQGADDATRVVEDISIGGGRATARSLSVAHLRDEVASLAMGKWTPTHLYYFATPPIFRAMKNRFSADLFREFCSFYVDTVATLVSELAPLGLVGLYYPSSVAVDELSSNMGEYAAAKAAGETLCAFLEKTIPKLRVVAPRLPRSATDQTASLLPIKNEDPAVVLLKSLSIFKQPSGDVVRPIKVAPESAA